MKEERKREDERQNGARSLETLENKVKSRRLPMSEAVKIERKKIAQLQELENTIAALEKDLANLGAQLESPFVNAKEVIKLGKEYERVQKEMDVKLNEWEELQG